MKVYYIEEHKMMMLNVFIFFPIILYYIYVLTYILEVSTFCWYNAITKMKMIHIDKDYFDSLLDWINNVIFENEIRKSI